MENHQKAGLPSGISTVALSLLLLCGIRAGAQDAGRKTVELRDPHFQNMNAQQLSIPNGWNFSGVVLRQPACNGGRPQALGVFRAQSKDGLTGVQVLPAFNWVNADRPQVTVKIGVINCAVYDDISIRDLGRYIASGRPNARIVEVSGPIDGRFAEQLKGRNEQFQAMSPPSVRASFPPMVARGEQGRVRIAYTLNGQPVEEWIVINKVITRSQYVATVDAMGRGTSWDWIDTYHVEAFGLRAPQGKLDGEFGQLLGIRRSIRPDDAWSNRESNAQKAFDDKVIRQTNENIQANYEMLHRQSIEMMRSAAANDDAANRHGADVADMLAGRQFTRNEKTGQTQYVPLDQEKSYQNSRTGEVVSSKNTNFDPNEPGQNWTDPGDWDRLRPITH